MSENTTPAEATKKVAPRGPSKTDAQILARLEEMTKQSNKTELAIQQLLDLFVAAEEKRAGTQPPAQTRPAQPQPLANAWTVSQVISLIKQQPVVSEDQPCPKHPKAKANYFGRCYVCCGVANKENKGWLVAAKAMIDDGRITF